MTFAFFVILAWCFLPLAAALLDGVAPFGWQDERGFHFGEQKEN